MQAGVATEASKQQLCLAAHRRNDTQKTPSPPNAEGVTFASASLG